MTIGVKPDEPTPEFIRRAGLVMGRRLPDQHSGWIHLSQVRDEMRQLLEKQVDLIIDGGFGGGKASTVINLADGEPEVIRVGCGDPAPFMVEA